MAGCSRAKKKVLLWDQEAIAWLENIAGVYITPFDSNIIA